MKQTIGGTTTTIYDGLAAGAWFSAGEQPVLTTYRRSAATRLAKAAATHSCSST
ncbi:MAG TPA: hypothetical protein VNY10_19540 [Roseiarcus sp.]|nr:hypothetical protein [Roseiarcus sp.]